MKKREPKSKNQKKPNNQYHPPFCAALELELLEYKRQIEFTPEYVLNSKPNTVDLLITKENPDIEIHNGLGAIFRKYNLIEYKSPADSLSETIYHRSAGYVHLFLAYHGGACTLEDVTLTLIRERMPKKLMKRLSEWDFDIIEYEPGIYHIRRPGHVDMQIVVTSRLGRAYKWITKLTSRLCREDVEDLRQTAGKLTDAGDKRNAEAVFDLIMRLNESKEWMKELKNMGALRDLFKEDFEQRDQRIAELSERLESQKKQLQSKEEQLQSKEEQLQTQEEQLENKDQLLQSKEKQLQGQEKQLRRKEEENTKLKKEIEKLKKQLNSQSAMF